MDIHVIQKNGRERTLIAEAGQNLMAVLKKADFVEGACNGSLACSTCHVILPPEWAEKLPAAQDDERDMLDLASGLQRTSRLACQITLTSELNGLRLTLPKNA